MKINFPITMKPHVEKVIQGEYDSRYWDLLKRPIILDIGANIGSFAAWANMRWPQCKIYCYEPLSSNFIYLKGNLGSLENVTLYNNAVGDPANTKLYLGKNNCGESSFYQLGEQQEQYETVVTIAPKALPFATVLKMDTEGSEVDILQRFPLIRFDAVMLEYHSDEKRRQVDSILMNYCLVGGQITDPNHGIAKYLRKDLLQI